MDAMDAVRDQGDEHNHDKPLNVDMRSRAIAALAATNPAKLPRLPPRLVCWRGRALNEGPGP
jgi:hypothetical protein